MESMAHNEEFSNKDIELTQKFLNLFIPNIKGDRVLTLCEGISRNGTLLSQFFNMIDVCDIKPSFGKIPSHKQG